MPVQRIAAGVEYNGRGYRGWQQQTGQPSVQAAVEQAIGRVADEPIRVITAGRTDTGVHALEQVVHFDTSRHRSDYAWLHGVNRYLPTDISLLWTRPVEPAFHARFSAIERSYRYIIFNRRVRPSCLHGLVTWHVAPLDPAIMQQAATGLLGRHDFSAFRAAGCQSKQPQRTIHRLEIGHCGAWIWLDIRADGFLYRMVRNIVGVLCRIGQGLEPPQWATRVLATRDRRQAGVTAAADGLYFVGVRYDPHHGLPENNATCRFW